MKNEEPEDDLKKALDLYLNGRLSAKQKEQMDKALEEFRKSDNTPYEFDQHHSDELWKKIAFKTVAKETNRGRLWTWIAATVIFASIATLLTLSWDPGRTELSNKIILDDGTLVWLKPGADLDHSAFTSADRQVILKGEALFEVAKIRDSPFVIHCGRYEARVLGTSFNIKATDSLVELTVLTGSVKLSSLETDSSVLVNSHEYVVFSESNGIVNKSPSTTEYITSVTANTQYDMHFEDTRMEDVVKRVEGKFDVHVDLKNPDISNCMISADFTDQSLPITLNMISEALGVQYEIDGTDILISGAGCKE